MAIAKPLCKAAYRILNAEDIGVGVARAIRAASRAARAASTWIVPASLMGQTMDAAARREVDS